jgi:hypothetical protein
MSEKQLELYDSILGQAPPWVSAKIKSGLPPSKQESKDLNAYLSGVRQISNTTAPFITEGDPEAPKIQKAFEEFKQQLKKNERMKAVIYSNYLEGGINPYKQLLEKEKIPYGVFSGEVNKKERDALIQQYNEDKLKALLLSSAGGEGLDLKGTRLIQVLEPHWNDEKLKQVEGRGIRFKSHDHLPPEERKVLIQRYMATRPKSLLNKLTLSDPSMAVDQYLAARSKEKEELNQQFRDLFTKIAFDLFSKKEESKKENVTNEEALRKAEEIRKLIGKKYNVTPFLTGSLRLGTNVPGVYDYDYNIQVHSKKKFDKLVKKFHNKYEPSEYNKPGVDHHIYKMNLLGEDIDVGITYGQKGRDYQNSVREAEEKLTDSKRQEIIEQKKKLQKAWFFKERRYKNFKKSVDEELGIKRFARERIKEGFALHAKDIYGHRTNNLDSIINNGLLSAKDAYKKGLLKDFETNHSVLFGRGRSLANELPKELKTEIFLTPGLLPANATYGKYGVLFKKRKVVASPYINTVPNEVVTDAVKSKMVFVVPKEELKSWEDKYKDHKFITEEEVPENKRLPARDYLEIPRRLLAGGTLFHKTEKVAERTKEDIHKETEELIKVLKLKRPIKINIDEGNTPEIVFDTEKKKDSELNIKPSSTDTTIAPAIFIFFFKLSDTD